MKPQIESAVHARDFVGSPESSALAGFAALGQQTRLAILRHLVQQEPDGLSVKDIADAIGCPQNTASGHLAILARARLVTGNRSGRTVVYRADLSGFRALIEFLMAGCCNGNASICTDLVSGIHADSSMQPAACAPLR